jgi:uncharacterized protein
MSTADPLRIPIADLLRRPGASRSFSVEARAGELHESGVLEDLGNGAATVPTGAVVGVAGTLEHVADGIVVRGVVHAPWQAACSRCLQPVTGEVSAHVDELFEPAPLEGETYPLDDDTLDLSPLVRDALLLDLPAAPVCREDCAGICATCGADRNEAPCACVPDDTDPRWSALRSLEL